MSAAAAPLPVRRREDLVIREQWYRGVRHWCVKDPVARSYAHLRDEEFAVLSLLDGRATAASVRAAFARAFPGRSLPAAVLGRFLADLRAGGLVVAPPGPAAAGVGKAWAKKAARLPTALLALRFRGFDPTALLDALYGPLRFLFSAPFLLASVGLCLSAVGLAVARAGDVAAALPDAGAFLSAANLPWLLATLAGVKVVHELAHGLTCRHYGGECRELGVMLLVFAPCLYCDVSDSWLLASRRKRIAVAAAGVLAELVIAAAALWLWWVAEPGLFRTLCLNAAVVCSVGTVLFNGNPLLRYDGYFVLSDALEIPNLAERAKAEWRATVGGFFRGSERTADGLPPRAERFWLLGYGAAALAYRVFLAVVIAWLLFAVLTPLGLRPVAWALATGSFLALAAPPVMSAGRGLAGAVGGWRGARADLGGHAGPPPVRPGRALAAAAVVGGLAAAVAAVPLPEDVTAPAVLRPAGAVGVYAVAGGTLARAASPGDRLTAGDPVAVLADPALDRAVEEARGTLAVARLRADGADALRLSDPAAAAEADAARRSLDSLQAQLDRRSEDRALLTARAPVAGVVVAPPLTPRTPDAGVTQAGADPAAGLAARLPGWSGTPLDGGNRGAFVAPGTLLALVAPGDPFGRGGPGERETPAAEARLVVSEADVQRVVVGQAVRLRFDQKPGETFAGVVSAVAAEPLARAPRELAGTVVALSGDPADARPATTSYQVRVSLDPGETNPLRLRGVGTAKVRVAARPLLTRAWRALRRTFRFEL